MDRAEKFQLEIQAYPKDPDHDQIALWREHGRPRYEGRPEIEESKPSITGIPVLIVVGLVALALGLVAFFLFGL